MSKNALVIVADGRGGARVEENNRGILRARGVIATTFWAWRLASLGNLWRSGASATDVGDFQVESECCENKARRFANIWFIIFGVGVDKKDDGFVGGLLLP